jgi:hypothetical protein
MIYCNASHLHLNGATNKNTPQTVSVFRNFKAPSRRANHYTETLEVPSSQPVGTKHSKPVLLPHGTTIMKFQAVDRDCALAIEKLFECNAMTQNLYEPRPQMSV